MWRKWCKSRAWPTPCSPASKFPTRSRQRFALQFRRSGAALWEMFLRLTTRQTAWCAGSFALLIFFACAPAFAQTVPPEPDPLARIRAQPPAQACSAKEITLCDEAAPKIIANAMGKDSTIEENLRELANGEDRDDTGAPVRPGTAPPPNTAAQASVEDWAVAAFHAVGLDARVESSPRAAGGRQYVVAEIRGREKPNEIVVLAAIEGQGTPLGVGPYERVDAAVLVEAARDIAATGIVPRRTIRFVLFYAWGIDACDVSDYVSAHRAELDRTVAAIFVSQGTGQGTRFLLSGRHDIEPQVREALKPLATLAPTPDSYDLSYDNCIEPFLDEGVPTLVADRDGAENEISRVQFEQMNFQ